MTSCTLRLSAKETKVISNCESIQFSAQFPDFMVLGDCCDSFAQTPAHCSPWHFQHFPALQPLNVAEPEQISENNIQSQFKLLLSKGTS